MVLMVGRLCCFYLLNEIVSKCSVDGYKFSGIVLAIVESDTFLKRREKRSDEK